MVDKVVVAIFGLGRIGKVHAEILQKHVDAATVKYAVDANLNEEMKSWAASLGIPHVANDPAQAFADPEVNAVYICTSTNTHSDYITMSARAGKDIFCEKPLDSDLGRLAVALKEVDKAGVLFQTGLMRRFDRNHSLVKKTIQSGEIGQAQMIKITGRDTVISPYDYLKVSGGIFFDMMIHDFDMIRFLSGSEVDEVYAAGSVFVDKRLSDIPDVDTAVAVLRLASGAIAVVDSGRQAFYGHDQRSEVYCSKGTVQAMNETESTVVVSNGEGVHCPKPYDFFINRYMQAYIEQAIGFIDCVKTKKPTAVTANDGIQAIRIAKAAQMSFDQHRPVKVSEVSTV